MLPLAPLHALLLAGSVGAQVQPLFTYPMPVPVGVGGTLNEQLYAWTAGQAAETDGSTATYSIQMSTGATYTISAFNMSGGNTNDVAILLFAPDGVTLAAMNDGGGRESQIVYTAPAAGSYLLKLRAPFSGGYGYCTLTVTSSLYGGGNLLYPDLVEFVYPGISEYDAYLAMSGSSKQLVFSNAVANVGNGPFDYYGVVQPDGNTVYSYQRILDDAGGVNDFHMATFAWGGGLIPGRLYFIPWNTYNVRTVTAGGGLGPVVATNNKTAFGIADDVQHVPHMADAGPSVHDDTHQGLNVGWADIYAPADRGQYVDVTSVPDGVYWLETLADPKGEVRQNRQSGGTAWLKLQIQGMNVSTLSGQPTQGGADPADPAMAQAFPNPLQPSLGQTAMTITGLSPGASVRIFTLTGERVRTLSASGASVRWDGRNDSGADAASGVYIALIDSGGSRATLKVAIQR